MTDRDLPDNIPKLRDVPSPETPTPQTYIPQTDAVELPDTEVIAVPRPDLVFVDATGRRRRMLRRASYGFAAVCVAYGGLVGVSLAGGPVSTSGAISRVKRSTGARSLARTPTRS